MDGSSEDSGDPGLVRRVVETAAGPVVVHAGEPGGPGTVLIHGAAGSWTTWIPLLQEAVRAGTPLPGVVALDLPGWGGSPDPRDPLTADGAARLVAEVARACGHDRWTVVGHSLGGFVALRLAALEPSATTGVVLVSPTGPAVIDAVRRPLRGGARLPWFAGMLVAMRVLAALPREGRALLRLLDRTGVLRRLAAPLLHDRHGDAAPRALAVEIRPRAFVRAARAAAAGDAASWPPVRCAVRSVRGRRDVFVGPEDAAALSTLLPDFAEQVLPDAGHYATAERPDAVLAALQDVGRPRRGR